MQSKKKSPALPAKSSESDKLSWTNFRVVGESNGYRIGIAELTLPFIASIDEVRREALQACQMWAVILDRPWDPFNCSVIFTPIA